MRERRAVYGGNVLAQQLLGAGWIRLARAFLARSFLARAFANPFIAILFILAVVALFTDVLLAPL